MPRRVMGRRSRRFRGHAVYGRQAGGRLVHAYGPRGCPADTTLACEEVFGPVLTVLKVSSEAEAFAAVNDSKYGLQTGVFTRNLQAAFGHIGLWKSAES